MTKQLILIAFFGICYLSCAPTSDSDKLKAEKDKLMAEIVGKKTRIAEIDKMLTDIDPQFREEHETATLVSTITPKKMKFQHQIVSRGTVKSKGNIEISTQVGGKIESIRVKESDMVKKGDVLFILDAKVLSANIAEVRKQYDLAKVMYEKRAKLWKQKIGTEVAFLESKNKKETLEKKIASLHSQKNLYTVKAPITGIVDKVVGKVGQLAMQGSPIVNILGTGKMYVQADFSEAYLGIFNKETKVQLKFPNIKTDFDTVILSVGQIVNPQNRTFTLDVQIPTFETSYKAVPNQTCTVSIIDYENPETFVVPAHIILEDDKGKYVYIKMKKNNHFEASKKRIQTGKTFEGKTEILDGLTGEEEVVDQGYDDMAEGLRIKIAEKKI